MTDNTENLVLKVLQDLQTRMGRMEERLTSMELRMTAQGQHLATLLVSLPVGHDRLDFLTRRVDRIERRLEPADGA